MGAEVCVLGPFTVWHSDGQPAGPWERPVARRLVQLLAVQPTHRLGREAVQELFFSGLTPARAANALSKALTMVRRATRGGDLVEADRTAVWLRPGTTVDLAVTLRELSEALRHAPGVRRDRLLTQALLRHGTLLEDELYAEWPVEPRRQLEEMRMEARRALARDRASGHGAPDLLGVARAWADVLAYEPADEEACLGLVDAETAMGHRGRAMEVLQRTLKALADYGLSPTPALDQRARSMHDRVRHMPRPLLEPAPVSVAFVAATMAAASRARQQLANLAALSLFTEALEGIAALSAADRASLRRLHFDALVQVAELRRDQDAVDEAERLFRDAITLAQDDTELARAWSGMSSVPYRSGDLPRAVDGYQRGLASLTRTDSSARLRLVVELAFALQRMGHGPDALEMLEVACRDLDDVDDPRLVGLALDKLSVALRGAGRYEESLDAIQRAFAAVGVLGDEPALAPLHIHRAGTLARLGRTGEGLADTAAAKRITRAHEDRYTLSVAYWVSSDLYELRGDIPSALAERDIEAGLLHELDNLRNMAGCQAARARLLLRLGRADLAAEAAQRARDAASACDDRALMEAVEKDLTR